MRLLLTIMLTPALSGCMVRAGGPDVGSAAQVISPAREWVTNGPAVFELQSSAPVTNQDITAAAVPRMRAFNHFAPQSVHNLVWTNLIAHTNGRTTQIWSVRIHPPAWPLVGPDVKWDTNCLMWGFRGLTALSPCWEGEGSQGQVPITALTRRHGYTRGHGMGPDGFGTRFAGKNVWFVARDNTLVKAKIVREVVRTFPGGGKADYTIVLFDRDLPNSIEPVRVVSQEQAMGKYPPVGGAPYPVFKTEQGGQVSADIQGFTVNTFKGGDSGSPNLIPIPGELVFFSGRSTSGPSPAMQEDMDELCRLQKLDPAKYRLRWAELSPNQP